LVLVVVVLVVAGWAAVTLFAAGAAGGWAANTVPTARAMESKVVFIFSVSFAGPILPAHNSILQEKRKKPYRPRRLIMPPI
jgi:hypothetical protein